MGKGKLAIAHTIAAWAKDLGVLGSYFCFARDRQAENHHENDDCDGCSPCACMTTTGVARALTPSRP